MLRLDTGGIEALTEPRQPAMLHFLGKHSVEPSASGVNSQA